VDEPVDLLVVGAGIYGASLAHAAALRGLRVEVVERADFCSGASANSLKVAHGGMRYLQSLDVSRYLESIRERRRLLALAPRWVKPQRFTLDLGGRSVLYKAAFRAGLALNELGSLHRNRGLPTCSQLPHAPFPDWYDGLIDSPERVVVELLLAARDTAPDRVRLHSHAPLLAVEPGPSHDLVAEIGGGIGRVRARAIARCTGAAAGSRAVLLAMNLVMEPVSLGPPDVAVGLRHPDDGRNLFAVPWRGTSMLGTYYRSYAGDPAEPLRVAPEWVDEALAWIRSADRRLRGLERRAIRFVHAGLLPADTDNTDTPADRPHVGRSTDGSWQVQGVKWTTAYGVAESALERILAATPGLHARPATRSFGALDTCGQDREQDSAAIHDGCELAALERAVKHELARSLEDVLLRRSTVACSGHPGRAAVARVANALRPMLGWSQPEMTQEIERFDASFHFAGNVPD